MAGYIKCGDVYEWHLNAPPAAVSALLKYVCVNMSPGSAEQHAIGHLLWGPKSWGIQFEGTRFCLFPLPSPSLRSMVVEFAPYLGAISETKCGSHVQLTFASTRTQRQKLRWLLGVFSAVFGGGVMAIGCLAGGLRFWSVPASLIIAALFFCAWFWIVPGSVERKPLIFLDELFAQYAAPQ